MGGKFFACGAIQTNCPPIWGENCENCPPPLSLHTPTRVNRPVGTTGWSVAMYMCWWVLTLCGCVVVGLFGLSELCVDVGGRDINGSSLYQIASLATGLAYSFFALKETLTRKDLVAYALIITGALLALWVVDLVEVSVLVFVIYVFLVGFALFFLYLGIWHYRKKLGTSSMGDPQNKRIRKAMPILYSAITAVIQALIV